jgi:TPR repeat protein
MVSIRNQQMASTHYKRVTSNVHFGISSYKGNGIPKDSKKAVYWLTKAAEQGDALFVLRGS